MAVRTRFVLLLALCHAKGICGEVCEELRTAISPSGKVLCGEEISTYAWEVYNTRCAEITLAAIVQPTEAEHVKKVVSIVRKHGLPISTRGTGHTYNCNAFKNGSVNLDMRTMGQTVSTEVSSDGTAYAHLAPGATFQHMLHPANIPSEYSFTHGTCPSVGVMGFHLHGGWGATTSEWANESIVGMQVVTADGTLLKLDNSSKGSEADLFKAMHVAGSSFGIVTSLTIKLFNRPNRPAKRYALGNTFEQALAMMSEETSFGWVGLARWDSFFLTPVWLLQVTFKDDTADTTAKFEQWKNETGIAILAEVPPNMELFMKLRAHNWKAQEGPYPESGMFSRLYEYSELYTAARRLHEFFADRADVCRFNFGPLKGQEQLPIVTLECNTKESVTALKDFVETHADELKPDKPGSGYVNLPLDGSRKYNRAYYPQYDELEAIKNVWDPDDFFNVENGIHPSAEGADIDIASMLSVPVLLSLFLIYLVWQ